MRHITRLLLLLLLVLPAALLADPAILPRPMVRGKAPAQPITTRLDPERQRAQALALADRRVQALTTGQRSEVLEIVPLGDAATPASKACLASRCFQVNIYNFADNATVAALVDLPANAVRDVLAQPGIQPGVNERLKARAVAIIHQAPEVAAALGFQPAAGDIAVMDASLSETACGSTHLCAAATFITADGRILWAFVDLSQESLAGLRWGRPEPHMLAEGAGPGEPTFGCPPPGTLTRDGWTLQHEVTASDGLRVYNVSYFGRPVLTSAKLVEWHADYGGFGFRDATGCSGGGGFPIFPYGDTQVRTLPEGFELVQDFRMANWGNACNYRYEQHLQFFSDGRFRVVAGAYGKGCYGGTPALYLPVLRLDVAPDGSDGNNFFEWDGGQWVHYPTEQNTPQQGAPYTAEGFKWKVTGQLGVGFYIEPGQGQFGDGGLGDAAYVYVTRHRASEGDTDMGALGACCNGDYRQGPDGYLNHESLTDANIVIWYVPNLMTQNDDPANYYCWTVAGEPTPETYPCFGGPMFVPTAPLAEHIFLPFVGRD